MKHPLIAIEMESGKKIEIELFEDIAPNTVRNFLSLVSAGFYDGLIFHRVIPGFMIQGGDPQGDGTGGPGYKIFGEFPGNGFAGNELVHERGVVSMARAMDPDSAGSQFFIVVEDAPHLDGQYAAFGRVLSGMEEVDRIARVKRDRSDRPLKGERMKKATAETFGAVYEAPEKL